MTFLSTPSARRATDTARDKALQQVISIHALREEGDCVYQDRPRASGYFYPRPPRGGRRDRCGIAVLSSKFLSTPSARRATLVHSSNVVLRHYFYPRPPRGGRLPLAVAIKVNQLFLSTPSARRATFDLPIPKKPNRISIHALREEGDRRHSTVHVSVMPISIHALREEGDDSAVHRIALPAEFLSTPSARRAT